MWITILPVLWEIFAKKIIACKCLFIYLLQSDSVTWLHNACIFGLPPWFLAMVYVRNRCCASRESSKINVLQFVYLNLVWFNWWERYKTCCLRCNAYVLLSIQNPSQVNTFFVMWNRMFYINENSKLSLGQVKKIRNFEAYLKLKTCSINEFLWKHAQSMYLNELNTPLYSINSRSLFFASYTSSLYFLKKLQILYILSCKIYAANLNTV